MRTDSTNQFEIVNHIVPIFSILCLVLNEVVSFA